jgi:hypothetical protein
MERSAMQLDSTRTNLETAGATRATGPTGSARFLLLLLLAGSALVVASAAPEAQAKRRREVSLSIARIYWEYNASADDLGVHVSLDGEDWVKMKIVNPNGKTLFKVEGKGPYAQLGMTELFFEGAEPALADFPLEDLLELFPEGIYEFEGTTANGDEIEGEAVFTHAIPAGPAVSTDVGSGDSLVIRWDDVTAPPEGFPDETIEIVGYQVIVGSFQVTLPATANSVTVPPEFVASLGAGEHLFEVLAIEVGHNQTLTEGAFTLP